MNEIELLREIFRLEKKVNKLEEKVKLMEASLPVVSVPSVWDDLVFPLEGTVTITHGETGDDPYQWTTTCVDESKCTYTCS